MCWCRPEIRTPNCGSVQCTAMAAQAEKIHAIKTGGPFTSAPGSIPAAVILPVPKPSKERDLRVAAVAAAENLHAGGYVFMGAARIMAAYTIAASERIITLETFESLMAYEAKQDAAFAKMAAAQESTPEKEPKMDKENIAIKVQEIILKVTDIDPRRIVPTAHLADDLKLDSLDRMEMVLGLEDEIGGAITDEEAANLKTVADVYALMEKTVA